VFLAGMAAGSKCHSVSGGSAAFANMTIKNAWRQATAFDRAIIIVYVIAFTGATVNHIADLVRGGLFPYSRWWGVPPLMNAFWTSLTILDPAAIVALLVCAEVGCVLYLAVMISDVACNVYAEIVYWKQPVLQSAGLMLQAGFLIFLLFTIGRIFDYTKERWMASGKQITF
jgi:hypothetical protein